MLSRMLGPRLQEAASRYPIVTLTGPRQSGKTTLVRALFPDHAYLSLEVPDVRRLALDDPRGFLGGLSRGAILDEVQRAPELFSYLQGLVDDDPRPGRFILTGSQNFLLMRSISQTLAGRASILHLLPFSLDELLGRPSLAIESLTGEVPAERTIPDRSLEETLFAGFYPAIHDRGIPPQDWLGNYHQTYLERDVRDLVNVGDLDAFDRFVSLCAGRTGQLLDRSSLASDCGISHTTASRWLSVLTASFLVVLLQPYHASFNKRLIKSPKLYFLDTGLLCRLLRIRSAEDLSTHAARGAVFESFVLSELWKRRVHAGLEPDLYFWRDSAGHEVDLIADAGPRPIAIEVKSGRTLSADQFRGLDYWAALPGQAEDGSVLAYAGDLAFQRHGARARPWWAL